MSVVTAPRLLVICGSTRVPSFTRTLAMGAAQALREQGADVVVRDVAEPVLPIADPAYHKNAHEHPDACVRELDREAHEADAFVFASPVYHNSFSGVLKNHLDHLNIPHFANKPVGLLSHGGDRSPQAVDQLRIVVRGLNGVATPTHVCTRRDDYETHDSHPELANGDIVERVERFAAELFTFAVLFSGLREAQQAAR